MVLEFHELEFHQKNFGNFEGNFFKEIKFVKLEFNDKLEFHKLEFQKDNRLLNISQIVVYYKIFCKKVVFGS